MASGILHFLNEGVDDGGSALHFLDEGTGEGVLLITSSMKEKARGFQSSLSQKETDDGAPLFTSSLKEKAR